MRRAFFLVTTAIIVAYLTVLLIQDINSDVSMMRELAIKRSSVIKLSSCTDAIKEDLPRYLKREIEREIFLAASNGDLPNSSNIIFEKWSIAALQYLNSQNLQAELDVEELVFKRTMTNPEGALECIVLIRYALKDRNSETELEDQTEIHFIVPVRIYLISDIASSFRATVAGRIRRCFIENIGTDYQEVRATIIKTIDEYERSCKGMDLDFRASVVSKVVRDNETVIVTLIFEDTQITDMSKQAQVVIDGKQKRVTFRAKETSVTLTFPRR
ncbi:MAG: hypothetical protein ACUVTL_00480 [Thermoproteota archaeon]